MSQKKSSELNVEVLRHSAAHVLAAAVLEMFPEAKFGMGPSIENGFYYDFELPRTLIPEDLPLIEERMKKIITENIPFEREEISTKNAADHFDKLNQKYKLEIISDLEKEGTKNVSIYKSGHFVDLCIGPHLDSTGEIPTEGLKLTRISGAYWKGDENKQQLQRIYGLAFASANELDEYLSLREEAEKRDHRKLGKELGLFVFSELVGSGLPLYTHKGATIRREIIQYSNDLQKSIGYQEVHTPNINRAELFKVSGHYEKFKADMLQVVSNYSKEEYFLKPMNCPHHTQIYASQLRSYKDLPIRISDFANLYRDEKPGELSGLTRLRCFSQDDGHCFCREDQIKSEFVSVLGLIQQAMKTYNMKYTIRLSLWDPEHKEKYLGDEAVWEKSQKLLEEILIENKIEYTRAIGEAALYGPKMDLISKDSLGRSWQISTIQLDFIMPQRFGLSYIDSDGKEKTPVMIHRAIVGSPERFMGILIEHYAGAFPLWLSPVQITIIPVSEKFNDYANQVNSALQKKAIRSEINDRSETLGKRINEAVQQKNPYIVVVGEKEAAANSVAVRARGSREQSVLAIEAFIEKVVQEIIEKR